MERNADSAESSPWPRRLHAYEQAVVIGEAAPGEAAVHVLAGYFAQVTLLTGGSKTADDTGFVLCLDACAERVVGVQQAGICLYPASLVFVTPGCAAVAVGWLAEAGIFASGRRSTHFACLPRFLEGLLVAGEGEPPDAVLTALRACLQEQQQRHGRNHLYGLAKRFQRHVAQGKQDPEDGAGPRRT